MIAEPHPLRVLMVLESVYPATRGGGAEAQVRTMAIGLRARRQRVTVLVPMLAHGPQQRISRVDGVPVCRLRYPRIRLIGGPLLWLTLCGFLFSRRNRYDVWHVHIAHHLGAVCALMGRWLHKRVLIKVSGWWELEKGTLASKAWPWTRAAYHGLLRADVWLAISQRIAHDLVRKGVPPARIELLPNAVNTARFSGLRRTVEDTAPRFVFIGRLVKEKGLDNLIEAFAQVVPRHPTASLLLVGAGELLESLRAKAALLGIADHITFAGHRDDIEACLADANIGVLPSRIEGLSNTLLESMAAGLPMVASRISGNEDFVQPGHNGWLFEPDDRAALVTCLDQAAACTPSHRTAMGECARSTIEQQAGLDRVLNRLMALYGGAEPVLVLTDTFKRSA